MNLDEDDMALIRAAVDVSVARAVEKIDMLRLRMGTVASVNWTASTMSVTVDGDSAPVTARIVGGSEYAAGDRAALLLVPPSGLVAFGVVRKAAQVPTIWQKDVINFAAALAAGATGTYNLFTFTAPFAGRALVRASAFMLSDGLGAAQILSWPSVDGVDPPSGAISGFANDWRVPGASQAAADPMWITGTSEYGFDVVAGLHMVSVKVSAAARPLTVQSAGARVILGRAGVTT